MSARLFHAFNHYRRGNDIGIVSYNFLIGMRSWGLHQM